MNPIRGTQSLAVKFSGTQSTKPSKNSQTNQIAKDSFLKLGNSIQEKHVSCKDKNIKAISDDEDFDLDALLGDMDAGQTKLQDTHLETSQNLDKKASLEECKVHLDKIIADSDKQLETATIMVKGDDGKARLVSAKDADVKTLEQAINQNTFMIPVGKYLFMTAGAGGYNVGDSVTVTHEDGREDTLIVQHFTEDQVKQLKQTFTDYLQSKLDPSVLFFEEKLYKDDKSALPRDNPNFSSPVKEEIKSTVKKEAEKQEPLKDKAFDQKQVDQHKDAVSTEFKHAEKKDEHADDIRQKVLHKELNQEILKKKET